MARISGSDPEEVGLPPVTFLYTMDQIAVMLNVAESSVRVNKIYYHLRSPGRHLPSQMLARNIAAPDEPPDWRVTQQEFVRWLKLKGIRVITTARII